MRFVTEVDPTEYDAFVAAHPQKSHFMQSAAWGEFSRVERGYTPHYTALVDDGGAILAAALLLERKPPLFPPYLYAPRGYVVDFFNEPLLAAFSEGVRAFARTRGAMFVALDPDIELQAIGRDGAPVPGGFDNHELVARVKALGYRHRGYNKGFEGRQPRYTFRIDLTRDQKDIDADIAGNLLKNVKKSTRYAVKIEKGESADIADLYRLIGLTGERDAFVGYDKRYYQNFFDILDARGMAELWLGTAYPKETAALLRKEKEALLKKRPSLKKPGPLQESLLGEQRLAREIALFDGYAAQYPDGARISAHLVVRYGDKSWAVHAGSDKVMSETFLNNRVYYEKLCGAKQSGAKVFDQFGTVGAPESSPLQGLHEFKRQFGGRYIEFVGEFNMVLRPFWFFIYEKALPFYRSARIDLKMLLRKKSK